MFLVLGNGRGQGRLLAVVCCIFTLFLKANATHYFIFCHVAFGKCAACLVVVQSFLLLHVVLAFALDTCGCTSSFIKLCVAECVRTTCDVRHMFCVG